MRRISLRITLLILLIAACPATVLADLGGHDRDGVVVGFEMGHGWNSVQMTSSDFGELDTGDLSTFTGAFRVGWARSDNLVGFIGISGWKRSFSQGLVPSTATNLNFLVELHYFPRGEGFWVKGGVGSGSLDLWVNAPVEANRIDIKESGFTYTLGAGYEFRVSEQVAFGLCYDYTNINMGDFETFTDASTTNQVLAISINYYQ